MSIATYADLLTSVAGYLHRSDLTPNIPDFVTLAESKINKRLRIRQMETTTSSTMASGVISIPANYISLKDAYISNTNPVNGLSRKTAEWVLEKYPRRLPDKMPEAIARQGSQFIFGPYPDVNYTVTLVYWNRFAPLATSLNDTFLAYPGAWLFGALAESAPFLKNDSRVQLWEAKFKELLDDIQDESDDEYSSGGSPQISSTGPTP